MLSFLPVLVLLPSQGAFTSIQLDTDRLSGAVSALAPNQTTLENQPETGTPQIRAWRGDDVLGGNTVSYFLVAATSAATETNLDNLRKDIKRREDALTKDGGRP